MLSFAFSFNSNFNTIASLGIQIFLSVSPFPFVLLFPIRLTSSYEHLQNRSTLQYHLCRLQCYKKQCHHGAYHCCVASQGLGRGTCLHKIESNTYRLRKRGPLCTTLGRRMSSYKCPISVYFTFRFPLTVNH